ncbi:hypothetical protein HPP92_013361 [Vanilla planifolia]|uniref:Reverse transcriptase/retrotransposon-derived protein RNase H-like domain-containing protein n=1 Tax=Vanilla planifolia TaxID=51239 RepID=A0A835QUH5_VANPL|nr:hypothetical protein HPP92_013361 [Vanilla planifolia]
MDLMKKRDVKLVDAFQETFDKLKAVISSKLTLWLSDFELPFQLHMNVSNKAIGKALVQEGHHVAFENRKLNAIEQKYSTQKDCNYVLPSNLEDALAGNKVHHAN